MQYYYTLQRDNINNNCKKCKRCTKCNCIYDLLIRYYIHIQCIVMIIIQHTIKWQIIIIKSLLIIIIIL